ncbi:MAG: hypothetical protein AAGC95_05975, partial [Pseudomonadota bacterium]
MSYPHQRLDQIRAEVLDQSLALIDLEATFALKAGFDPNQPRWPLGHPWGGRWRRADGADAPMSSIEVLRRQKRDKAVIRRYQEGTETLSARQGAARIRRNVREGIETQIDKARRRAGRNATPFERELAGYEAMSREIVRLYASLALEVPEFQWPHLGVYVAPQVRTAMARLNDRRRAALALETVPDAEMFPGFPASQSLVRPEPLLSSAQYEALIRETFAGQRLIAEDVASLALAYEHYGADAMAALYNSRSTLGRAFEAQAKADISRLGGDRMSGLNFGLAAAKEFG